jgi:multidrug efflux pump subunit AcrB
VSFTLTPSLAARWFKPVKHAAGPVEDPTGMSATGASNAQIAAMDGTASTQHGAGHGCIALRRAVTRIAQLTRARLLRVIDRVYTAMLHWSMNHRWVIVLISALTLFSTVPLLRSGLVPFNFLPEDDESQFPVSMKGRRAPAWKRFARKVAAL